MQPDRKEKYRNADLAQERDGFRRAHEIKDERTDYEARENVTDDKGLMQEAHHHCHAGRDRQEYAYLEEEFHARSVQFRMITAVASTTSAIHNSQSKVAGLCS